MKIDESTINHNVARLIDELLLWDILGKDYDQLRIMTIGYIAGINELAKALKEVLEA